MPSFQNPACVFYLQRISVWLATFQVLSSQGCLVTAVLDNTELKKEKHSPNLGRFIISSEETEYPFFSPRQWLENCMHPFHTDTNMFKILPIYCLDFDLFLWKRIFMIVFFMIDPPHLPKFES